MKKQNLLTSIPILFLLLSCKSYIKPATNVKEKFHCPAVVQKQTKHPVACLEMDFMNEVFFEFRGKYKFTDTLFWDDDRPWQDSTSENDFINEQSQPEINDSLHTDGFQIIPDYRTSIYCKNHLYGETYCYFPVYIVNETSSTKVFYGKDSYAFGIQEAIDTSGSKQWHPIEAMAFDFCGNGSFGVKVHPGEFVILLVLKYQGELANAMRLRIRIGESLYISRSFIGSYSAKQFNINKDTRPYRNLKDRKNRPPFDLFYGAIPKGHDPY
ncbi:hypothetical protein [Chitinophaga rhizophila]|uniref:Lipoprotein n=1 Tax=Chitinophaga rhizophila TaxID=2866212 RepID=A0ABS7GBK0_9BACT|nr:hypothetical protein [Chitinophaga rhizophila]MBW8684706.1 hypothetical protein [Chitinophaga rhizophila]